MRVVPRCLYLAFILLLERSFDREIIEHHANRCGIAAPKCQMRPWERRICGEPIANFSVVLERQLPPRWCLLAVGLLKLMVGLSLSPPFGEWAGWRGTRKLL